VAEPLFEVEDAGAAAGSTAAAAGAAVPPDGGNPHATIVLRVHVQPAAGRASVVGRHGGALHLRVAAPPVGGRANAAAAELVAEVLEVEASKVELAGGEHSRSKRFRVRDVDLDSVARRLDLAVDQAGRRSAGTGRGRTRR
jgi:uncharacterized protein (TIGR00251 family)